MTERESQIITMSRQGIIVVTALGVGLLTFCFVIGVQVGKRSLTQKTARVKTLDEELNELPEPLDRQIELFRSIESAPDSNRSERQLPAVPVATEPASRASSAQAETPPGAASPEPAAPVQAAQTQAPSSTAEMYTAQVVATRDINGANRIAEQLNSVGMPSKVVFADGFYKVQLAWSGTKRDLDSRLSRLQILGYQPIAVRVQ